MDLYVNTIHYKTRIFDQNSSFNITFPQLTTLFNFKIIRYTVAELMDI